MMGMDEEEDEEEEKQVSLSEQKVSSRFILASILHKGSTNTQLPSARCIFI